jgi:integrase
MVILALCTGVRCSELVALKWSDFDWQNLSVHIRRAIVSGRLDDVKTEYSEAPLPLDPALAEVIFEWRRRTEFSSDSDFVRAHRLAYASPYLQGVVGRQWRASYGPEGAHEARIHTDHSQYVWWRDDGLNAGSPWKSRKASDRALMDVSGRQRVV